MGNQVLEKNSNSLRDNHMNIKQIKPEELIKAGAHFGHPVRKWNPKFIENTSK